MAHLDESREMERSNDAPTASDEFAAQLAALVFEWRLAQTRNAESASSEPTPSNQLWMSRITHRADVTS